jgi:hypothetical protein
VQWPLSSTPACQHPYASLLQYETRSSLSRAAREEVGKQLQVSEADGDYNTECNHILNKRPSMTSTSKQTEKNMAR